MIDVVFKGNKSMKKGNGIRYIINLEKKTVTCILSDCYDIVENRVFKYRMKDVSLYSAPHIKNEFVGVAKCSPEDVFDEKIGMALALDRAKFARKKAINSAVSETIRQLNGLIDYLNEYGYSK